jgi:hypothetical protein
VPAPGLRRPDVFAGIAAAAIMAADDAAYAGLITAQHGPYDSRTFFIASFLLLLTIAAIVAAVSARPLLRAALFATAAAGCLGLGIVGIFSIGAPLLLAAALAVFAASRGPAAQPLYYAAGAAAGLGILVLGFLLTSLDNLPK